MAATYFLRFTTRQADQDYITAINADCPWFNGPWVSTVIYPRLDTDGKWVAPFCRITDNPANYPGYVPPGAEVVSTVNFPPEEDV